MIGEEVEKRTRLGRVSHLGLKLSVCFVVTVFEVSWFVHECEL